MSTERKQVDLEFVNLSFYDNYVLSVIQEDSIIEAEEIDSMLDECKAFFGNKPHIYISIRKNRYNVNPLIYYKLNEYDALKGIGIITNDITTFNTVNFESKFASIPLKAFFNLEEAQLWVKNILVDN